MRIFKERTSGWQRMGAAALLGVRGRLPRQSIGGEDGLMLIEVVISALLVGLIAIGTLGAFDSAGRASAEERARSQATLLAGQDEERLRGLNAATLSQLGSASRTVTENGTTFTITSSAQFVAGTQEKLTCEVSGGSADYIQTTSQVSWAPLGAHIAKSTKRVSQSSVVNVPQTRSLLVKVYNNNHEPVSGATVAVTNKAGTTTLAEQTTPESGCVIFGGLTEKEVKASANVAGWVSEAEQLAPVSKELTLSSTTLTSAEFVLAAPGTISAEFVSNGVPVTGDTFFATHSGVAAALVGGEASHYAATSTLGNLFPFVTVGTPPTANPYTVYAGDCAENEPMKVASVANPTAQVNAGQTTAVKVEVPELKLTAYEGTSIAPGGVAKEVVSSKIINTKCSNTAHVVKFTNAGVLIEKYQPYASELQVCVVAKISGKYYKSTQSGFSNKAKAGTTASFYVKASGYTESSSVLSC
jgi:hypothetical protein